MAEIGMSGKKEICRGTTEAMLGEAGSSRITEGIKSGMMIGTESRDTAGSMTMEMAIEGETMTGQGVDEGIAWQPRSPRPISGCL